MSHPNSNKANLSRREMLLAAGSVVVASSMATATDTAPVTEKNPQDSFRHCFNTGTILGQKLSITQQIEVTAKAGYHAIEPWVRDIQAYQQQGGSLKDLKKQIVDAGITVESAIGFGRWISDDDTERKQGLEDAKRDMDILQQIGGKRIAAPPTGATKQDDLDLFKAAERYRALLELGDNMGVIPQVEVWGFSKSLSRLGETAFVAIESGHPDACILPDVYHIFKGGSDFAGLKIINGKQIHVFHVNDYPAEPSREKMNDSHRVYPGDGVAPLKKIIRSLHETGFNGFLSLELFNRDYWKQDALTVAKTGLRKTKQVVEAAFQES